MSKLHEYNDGSKIFFTSDTHFHHENIIKFCGRPFGSLEEMDETMIEKWNEKVPSDGLVFHLGDFCFGGFQLWKRYRDRLHGDIILVKGNHDVRNIKDETAYNKLFSYTSWQMYVQIEGRRVYLNHVPFLCYGGAYRSKDQLVYQLFGHVHSKPGPPSGLDGQRLQYLFPTQYDVGVDNNNFEPISWAEVNDKIKTQIEERKWQER